MREPTYFILANKNEIHLYEKWNNNERRPLYPDNEHESIDMANSGNKGAYPDDIEY